MSILLSFGDFVLARSILSHPESDGSSGPSEALGKPSVGFKAMSFFGLGIDWVRLAPAHLPSFIFHLSPLAPTQLLGMPSKPTFLPLHNRFLLPGMLFLP